MPASVRVFFLAAALLLSGCGIARRLSPLKPQLRLEVTVAADANENRPVAVDLVSINDKDLSKDLAKMTAADWFQKRAQYIEDYPKASSIKINSWEWVPGQVVQALEIPMRKKPRAILVFADYATPGPHRAKIEPSIAQLIQLNREDMKVEALAK